MKPRGLLWRLARWIISRAANLTPEVVYYAKDWPVAINDKMVEMKSTQAGKPSPMSTAAIAISCAAHEILPKSGDCATIRLSGVTRKNSDIGDFEVVVRRLA